MKGFIAIFVVALAGASAKNLCPSEKTQEWGIEALLPHADCNKFYKCSYGLPVEQSCPAGLQYNADTFQCDHPQNVQCDGRAISEERQGSEELPAEDFAVDESGNQEYLVDVIEKIKFLPNGCPVDPQIHWLVASRWCPWFYYCVSGRRVRRSCPRGLHFNAKLQVCDYPRSAGCIKYWP